MNAHLPDPYFEVMPQDPHFQRPSWGYRQGSRTSTPIVCQPDTASSQQTLKHKALTDRGIDQMLEDARVDNKENDIEYMKPNGR
ncbi:hypothetical protein D0868_07917 [Hortaea werneckii]|uniref:Uncharacterized protein n=1 Tax=Hortaea werneckii TaxID=91943 RepID=A0A3M7AKQ2_HORWE|nr:hypothetical protein D0868_07917 [Hortaea werneckii]RMY28082.1 hypothetical protein D0866_09679 [Hortaea werneckii]